MRVYNIHNITLGNYENMDVSKLPQLWLAYLSDPSDSGESWVGGRGREVEGNQLAPYVNINHHQDVDASFKLIQWNASIPDTLGTA